MKTTETLDPDPAANAGALVWDQEAAGSSPVAPIRENKGESDANRQSAYQTGIYPGLQPLDPLIVALIEDGALFVINDSGGKDSQALRIVLSRLIPASQLLVIHATLGDVEWPGALEHAEAGAKRSGIPFVVAEAGKTFLGMVEHRFATRPEVPSWPSSSTRQCTSDLKRGPIEREIRRELKERGLKLVVNCMGIRAEESSNRAKLNPLKRNERNSVAGRDWFDWLPIFHLTRRDVFTLIAKVGETPHYAYAAGNERLSCMFCIMGSRNDIANAARHNPDLFKRYTDLETRTGYTMHQSRVSLKVLAGGVA